MLSNALKVIACLALVLLCGVLGLAGYIGIKYIIPVSQNVRVASDTLPQTMNSVKESADTANLVSTESLDLVGNANKLIDGLVVTNGKAGRLIDSGTATVARLGGVVDATTTRINALATAQAKAETVMDQIATIPPHVNGALDGITNSTQSLNILISDPVIKEALDSIPPAMNGLNSYVSGPLTFATNNAGQLEDTVNTSVGHVDARFFAPYTGTHPKVHMIVGIGKDILGLSEPAYYTKGVLGK